MSNARTIPKVIFAVRYRRCIARRPMLPAPEEQSRQQLRAQHARLRTEVEAARSLARRVLASGNGAGDLQMAIATIERDLLAHMGDEERFLEPALAGVDAEAPLRVELLRVEHAHQRAVLSILSGPTAWPASRVLAGRVLSFCDDLLEDMDFEDRELLRDGFFPEEAPVVPLHT